MSIPRSTTAPLSFSLRVLISWAPSPDPLATSRSGAAGRGAGRSGWEDFTGRMAAGARLNLGIFRGSWQFADWKHGLYLAVTAGLNNQRLG
jgi:hypothetical protein